MHKNVLLFILLFGFVSLLSLGLYAQQAIINLESDDTLPIAATRFDDAVELPKDNFSSETKNDAWERFERGELDQKAFIKLQEQYQAQVNTSKDPFVKRQNKKREIASIKKAKRAAKKKAKLKAANKSPAAKGKATDKSPAVTTTRKVTKKMPAVAAKGKVRKRMPASAKKRPAPTKAKKSLIKKK